MTHPAQTLLTPHLGPELTRHMLSTAGRRCPRQRVVDALASLSGVRAVALLRPARCDTGTALVHLRASGVHTADLTPLAAWASRPDTWLADRLMRHLARDLGARPVAETLPADAVRALDHSGLAHAISLPLARPEPGRPDTLGDWLLLATDGTPSRLAALLDDLRPALALLLEVPDEPALSTPLSLLFRGTGELVQATGPLPRPLSALRHGLNALRDPRLRTGPIACPVDAAATLTRLDGVDDQAPHWLIHLEPAPRARLEPVHRLTARQREVAELAACGVRNKEIAGHLRISPATVKVHLRAAYDVLGVGSRAELGAHGEALARRLEV